MVVFGGLVVVLVMNCFSVWCVVGRFRFWVEVILKLCCFSVVLRLCRFLGMGGRLKGRG